MNDQNNPFNILNPEINQQGQEYQASEQDTTLSVQKRIEKLIGENDIVLFMKGNPSFPQCGFSANSVAILNSLNKAYTTYNILEDQELRQALKAYSNWPTYPQLYVKGQLLGGNDILTELYQSGELQKAVDQALS